MSRRKAFLLRVTPELYAVLERWAGEELRSVNGQIEYLLTQAVRRAGRAGASGAPAPGEGSSLLRDDEEGGPPDTAPDPTGIP